MAENSFQGDLLAEETHSGRAWTVIILPALIGPVIGVALAPSTAGRWAVALVGVLAIGTFAMTWSGFQYRFLRHGVEIWMLGFRLRSIPKQSIVSYSIEPWAFLRGYGIRGLGNTRAYVWCNQVVHIRTSNGEVFLGHSDPERIVRDLDMVTGFVTRG
jgi:tellurite resistance protein TehA-like permease